MLTFICASAILSSLTVDAQPLKYKEGETTLSGLLATPKSEGKKPGILIIHDWDGLDAYEISRANQVASELGYVALAADIYGENIRPKNPAESGAEARKYYADPALFRRRLAAGLEALRNAPGVDPNRLAVMGYCFGGAGSLELARSGAAIRGAVSFHGGLSTTLPAPKGLKAKILICHAAQDPAVPQEQLVGFMNEMKEAEVDYQALVLNLKAHAFTKPGGSQYSPDGDRRSWAAMKSFFAEIFGA